MVGGRVLQVSLEDRTTGQRVLMARVEGFCTLPQRKTANDRA
jgi:hypothetical protein